MGSAARTWFISDEYRSLVADSETRGKAKSVLAVLAARDVTVPAEARDQILACTDLHQLDTWLARAATSTTISDVTRQPEWRQPGMHSPIPRFISEEYRTAVEDAWSKSYARSCARGCARGCAESVLRALAVRRVVVPAEARAQIMACTDLAQLHTWISRAGTAKTITDVTGGTPPARHSRRLLRRSGSAAPASADFHDPA